VRHDVCPEGSVEVEDHLADLDAAPLGPQILKVLIGAGLQLGAQPLVRHVASPSEASCGSGPEIARKRGVKGYV
jgi:hypothetical protein